MTETAAEIQQFVHEYAEEFSTADPEVIATHFHEPATFLTGDGVLVLDSRADVEGLFTGILDELCERGYDASEVGELEVEVLGPDRVRATVEWIRYTTSGSELERLVVTHLFRRTEDGWKMAVLAPHED
ncbi:MAG: nuclear transport factor 2 family protein [Haloarculaceae archaeon]